MVKMNWDIIVGHACWQANLADLNGLKRLRVISVPYTKHRVNQHTQDSNVSILLVDLAQMVECFLLTTWI